MPQTFVRLRVRSGHVRLCTLPSQMLAFLVLRAIGNRNAFIPLIPQNLCRRKRRGKTFTTSKSYPRPLAGAGKNNLQEEQP